MKYVIINDWIKYLGAVRQAPVEEINGHWSMVSRRDRRYGNAVNVSLHSDRLVAFLDKHELKYEIRDN